MAKIYHPELDVHSDVPDSSVSSWLEVGWQVTEDGSGQVETSAETAQDAENQLDFPGGVATDG